MNLVIVEEEQAALDAFRRVISKAVPGCGIRGFTDPQDAILHIMRETADAVIVGSHAETDTGIKTARILRNIWRDLDILVCAENGDDAEEAYRLHCTGYVVRPLTAGRVLEELQYLRKDRHITPAGLSSGKLPEEDELQIITFGNFEVFFHNKPLIFRYSRTKELLAYLVDRRGSMCSNREISAVLWEDDDYRKHISYFSNLRNDLLATLDGIGRKDAVLHKRGLLGINVEAVKCDLFTCLYTMQIRSGSRISAEEVAYRGEYMNQYSWAEETHSTLDRLLKIYR